MPAFTHELRVRYGECDPQGIVFNANYLAYFDHTVSELWRETMGSWNEMVAKGVEAVVGEANVKFRAPARFEDVVVVSASVVHLGTTSMKLELLIHRGEELLIEGWLRHVFVDAKTWVKTPIPEWVRAALAPYTAIADAGA
ncbi:acyl-CoA thioesterase [Solirubrobacter sp. CPCC 204708]|uniref:Acyl-CoA thioesterase n=1 Tax=Solirubrobacter deserti TaxID=2282478 RepID=A0ABT4RUB0_9ACTN|nr:thioesterase family protein [Solirubrobacter deserti]MBE2316209.1 acyl-CoA thioesterase [Solirubrobacter deserti]MDA0141835.1 acyl-CoA thioesterase [Solirubrobacter deserti]